LYKNFQGSGQNQKIGGEIALSKSFWLSYTLLSWFVLPLLFLYHTNLSINFRMIMGALTCSMWIRGIIELIMMFRFKGWKPIYGIIHDIFTIILIMSFFVTSPINIKFELVYFIGISLSLVLETYYAYIFYRHVGEKTQGDKAVWFANKTDPKFKQVLQITTIGNWVLFINLFIFLVKI
jgi:hypothetical protein